MDLRSRSHFRAVPGKFKARPDVTGRAKPEEAMREKAMREATGEIRTRTGSILCEWRTNGRAIALRFDVDQLDDVRARAGLRAVSAALQATGNDRGARTFRRLAAAAAREQAGGGDPLGYLELRTASALGRSAMDLDGNTLRLEWRSGPGEVGPLSSGTMSGRLFDLIPVREALFWRPGLTLQAIIARAPRRAIAKQGPRWLAA